VRKKFIAAGAALLATALFGQVASAKTLEDVLKEKGVITEADYKEVSKSKPFDYKLGKGVTFTSADEKHQLSVGSQMQFRYTLLDVDNSSNDQSKFELRRIKLNLNGYAFTKDLVFKITYNFGNTLLEETFLNYRLIDEAQIRFGQDKVPFGRQWITPSGANQFVDVSTATTAFVPLYDTGISINGKVAGGLVYYTVGGYGGAGQSIFRSARDNAFAARIAVNPLGDMAYSEADLDHSKKPLVSVGSSYYRNTLNPGETNRLGFATANTGWYGMGRALSATANQVRTTEAVDFNTAEVDAAFKWLGFSAQAEYFMAQADGNTSNNTARGQGYYVQAGYFVIPSKLELAARYSHVDPNRDISNDRLIETGGAVSWYFNKHSLKIQADYANIHKQQRLVAGSTSNANDDQQIRLQVQLLF
jgi:phosphate-selective porin OprO and OprP